MIEIFNGTVEKARKAYSSLAVAWFVFLTLTAWCGSKSSSQIEGELSDIESELLTRGDNQRNYINKDGEIYNKHLWKWDDAQIVVMLEWAKNRSVENGNVYDELIEKREGKLLEYYEAKAREAREARAEGSESVRKYNFDPNQFANSDSAIIESIRNRKKKGSN